MAGERTLPGLGLTGYWTLGTNGWKDGMDANVRLLSAVAMLVALSRTDALPGVPTDGMVYIVVSTDPTNPNKIAIRDLGAWVYIAPAEGWTAYVVDDLEHVYFNGANWVLFTAAAAPVALLDNVGDVNATTPTNGQVLTWDNATSTWVAATPAAGSVALLDSIGDVDAAAPAAGQVLTWNDATSKWVAATPAVPSGTLALSTKTANYTLVLADAQTYVRMNLAGANTLTVPPNASVALPVGTQVIVRQAGAGQTTVAAGAGVTINTARTLKLRAQHSSATLIKVATNEWDLTGDLEAV